MRLLTVIFMILWCAPCLPESEQSTTEQRQLVTAEQSIMLSLMSSASPNARRPTGEKNLCGLAGDAGEMAMALIAARDTDLSRRALVRLLRFKLDAEYLESYDCYVVENKQAIRRELSDVRPDTLHEECVRDFERWAKLHAAEFGSTPVDRVCSAPAAIKMHSDQLLEAIDSDRACPF